MLPFGVTIPATVLQRSKIPEVLTNYPVYRRVNQLKPLNMFYLVIDWTKKAHNDFIFQCSIVLPPVGHSSNHEYHCRKLQTIELWFEILAHFLGFHLTLPRIYIYIYIYICIIIIIFLYGLGRLTFSGIDALPSFPGASTVSSSSRCVFEGVFRESGVVHSFEMVDPVLFVFESHVLYSRDL